MLQLPVSLIAIGSLNPAADFTSSDWVCRTFNVIFMVSIIVPTALQQPFLESSSEKNAPSGRLLKLANSINLGIPAQPDFTDKVKSQAGSGQRSLKWRIKVKPDQAKPDHG
jgi:hypothetical protein